MEVYYNFLILLVMFVVSSAALFGIIYAAVTLALRKARVKVEWQHEDA